MKRILFIIGIIIIVILAGVLLFLLFASDDQKKDIFSAFDFGDGTDSAVILDTIVDAITPGEDRPAALRQLTLKRVVGATELNPTASSSSIIVYFVEAGTGHVFSLDVDSGAENRLSNITVPTANEAVINATGNYALILSGGQSAGRELTLVTLPGVNRELTSLGFNERVEQAMLTSDDKVLYTTGGQNNLIGREYDIDTNKTRTIFTLPFKEATVRFGKKASDPIYIYPKTAATLESAVYEVNSGVLKRLPLSGYGLTALANQTTVLFTALLQGTYQSWLFDTVTKQGVPLTFSLIADKCAFVGDSATLYCGRYYDTNINTPISWYQGTLTTSDELVKINAIDGTAVTLINLRDTSGRDIDVSRLTGSNDAVRLYFNNRVDGTLWIYDQSLATQ